MKYSHATEVSCEIVHNHHTVKACIYDNGVGFDPKAIEDNTMGLEEMSGRVRVVGGA